MYDILTAALILCLGVMLSATASAHDLTIYCEYTPPEKVTIGDKEGLIYAQVWELMRRTNIEGPIQKVSWKRGYAEATSKPNIGLFPTTRTPKREELFYWIGPVLQVAWAFYGIKGSGLTVNSLEDAKNVRSIGTYANDSKEQWLKAQGFTNLISVLDRKTNIKKLYAGRLNLIVGSPSITDSWPEQLGLDPTMLKMLYQFKSVNLYLAISKETPMEKVQALKKAFKDMVRDGTVRALYNKWAPSYKQPVTE